MYFVKDATVNSPLETQKMAPPVDFSGFDAPPLRLFYWANSVVQLYIITMATKDRRRERETVRAWGGRGHDMGKAVEAFISTY